MTFNDWFESLDWDFVGIGQDGELSTYDIKLAAEAAWSSQQRRIDEQRAIIEYLEITLKEARNRIRELVREK